MNQEQNTTNYAPNAPVDTEQSINHGTGITSLVMGIFSLVSIYAMPLLGIIFGIIGLSQAKKERNLVGNFAHAGYVTSKTGLIICLVLTLIFIIVAIVLSTAIMFGLGDFIAQFAEG